MATQTSGSSGSRTVDEPLDHEQRDAGAERELGEVEEGLEGRDLAVEGEGERRADEARRARARGRKEQQAGHQRQLAQRQRVGAPPEVQVHHPALGGRERERHQPPGHVQRRGTGAERGDQGDVGAGRGDRHGPAQYPDLGFQPELSTHGDHSAYRSKSTFRRKLTLRKLTRVGSTSPLASSPQSQRKLTRVQSAPNGEPLASRKLARRKLARLQSIWPVCRVDQRARHEPAVGASRCRRAPRSRPRRRADTRHVAARRDERALDLVRGQLGRFSSISATDPETTAVAIEVPLRRK